MCVPSYHLLKEVRYYIVSNPLKIRQETLFQGITSLNPNYTVKEFSNSLNNWSSFINKQVLFLPQHSNNSDSIIICSISILFVFFIFVITCLIWFQIYFLRQVLCLCFYWNNCIQGCPWTLRVPSISAPRQCYHTLKLQRSRYLFPLPKCFLFKACASTIWSCRGQVTYLCFPSFGIKGICYTLKLCMSGYLILLPKFKGVCCHTQLLSFSFFLRTLTLSIHIMLIHCKSFICLLCFWVPLYCISLSSSDSMSLYLT